MTLQACILRVGNVNEQANLKNDTEICMHNRDS